MSFFSKIPGIKYDIFWGIQRFSMFYNDFERFKVVLATFYTLKIKAFVRKVVFIYFLHISEFFVWGL